LQTARLWSLMGIRARHIPAWTRQKKGPILKMDFSPLLVYGCPLRGLCLHGIPHYSWSYLPRYYLRACHIYNWKFIF
jgi:hypothetical protein